MTRRSERLMADEQHPPEPAPPPHALAVAIERFDAGDVEGCRSLLAEVRAQTEPDVPVDLPLFEGLCARRQGDFDTAIAHLRDAALRAPEAPHLQRELGQALIEAGQVQEGLDALREAVRLSDDDPKLRHEFYLQNGIALYGGGYVDAAVTSLRKALRFDKDPVTYAVLGHLLVELKRDSDALDAIREGIEHFAHDSELHHIAGLALAVKQQPFEAAKAFTRAIELDPRRGDPLHSLGLCFESLGDATRAIEAYERCLRLECGDAVRADARQRVDRLRAQLEVR